MEQEHEPKQGRGRPLGSPNRPANLARYRPKKWTVEHEAIVLAHCAGSTNKELAVRFGFTPVHIGNILSSPQAAEIKERVRQSLNAEANTVTEKLKQIQEKAVERAHSFIHNDQYAAAMPVQVANVAIKMMQAIDPDKGRVRAEGEKNVNVTNNIQTNILADAEFLNDVKKGLALSEEVNRRVIEASAKILDE